MRAASSIYKYRFTLYGRRSLEKERSMGGKFLGESVSGPIRGSFKTGTARVEAEAVKARGGGGGGAGVL